MIRTLRITSVLVAIAAAVLIKYFVFPMVVGAGGDEWVDKVLQAPSVVERFRQTTGSNVKPAGDSTSPLVKQAEAFARHLEPKPKATPRTYTGKTGSPQMTLPPTSPKFKVFATAYFEGNPSLSQALIDEPGRERRWVRQSSMVGHLLIEQVKDGVVVVKSSKDTYELPVESGSGAAAVKKTPTTSSTSRISRPGAGQSITGRSAPSYSRAASGISRTPSRPPLQRPNPIPSEKYDKLIERLGELQKTQNPDTRAKINDLMSRFKPAAGSADDTKGVAETNRMPSATKEGKISTGSKEDNVDASSAKSTPPSSK